MAVGEGERCRLEEGVGMRRSSPRGEVGEKPHQITLLVGDGAAQSWQGGDISDTPVFSMACFHTSARSTRRRHTGTHRSCRPMLC